MKGRPNWRPGGAEWERVGVLEVTDGKLKGPKEMVSFEWASLEISDGEVPGVAWR